MKITYKIINFLNQFKISSLSVNARVTLLEPHEIFFINLCDFKCVYTARAQWYLERGCARDFT